MTHPEDPLARALREARREAAARVAEFESLTRDIAAARGDADTDDEHDPEGSTISWDRAVSAATAESARRRLADVDVALARVDAGWDGRCAGCGVPIPVERLAVRPQADRCVACAAAG